MRCCRARFRVSGLTSEGAVQQQLEKRSECDWQDMDNWAFDGEGGLLKEMSPPPLHANAGLSIIEHLKQMWRGD